MNLKWLNKAEVEGLVDPLPQMLDDVCELLQQRLRLTFTVGGAHCLHSTHYLGLAADIGLGHLAEGFERNTYRWALYKALYTVGFKRMEIAPLHAHVDIGQPPEYLAPDLWLGKDT